MTIKEYNFLRRSAYESALEIEEINKAVSTSGVAYIYEVEQGTSHVVLVLTNKAQLNDNALLAHGIKEPSAASVRLVMSLNRQTKCATF